MARGCFRRANHVHTLVNVRVDSQAVHLSRRCDKLPDPDRLGMRTRFSGETAFDHREVIQFRRHPVFLENVLYQRFINSSPGHETIETLTVSLREVLDPHLNVKVPFYGNGSVEFSGSCFLEEMAWDWARPGGLSQDHQSEGCHRDPGRFSHSYPSSPFFRGPKIRLALKGRSRLVPGLESDPMPR